MKRRRRFDFADPKDGSTLWRRRYVDFADVIDSSLLDCARAATKTGAEKISEQAVAHPVAKVLSGAASVTVGAIAGGALGGLVESLIKGVDRTKQLLERLASEPYETGTRIVKQALSKRSIRADQLAYRSQRLSSGIDKLESALTFSQSNDERIYILMLMGLAEMAIPGGSVMSIERFESAKPLLQGEIEGARQKLAAVSVVAPPLTRDDPGVRAAMEDCGNAGAFGKPIAVTAMSGMTRQENAYRAYRRRTEPYEYRIGRLTRILRTVESLIGEIGGRGD